MKRYIYASKSASNELVSAIITVLYSTMDMGDSFEDLLEALASMADVDLEYNEDITLKSLLTSLVKERSPIVSEFIIYSFTEDYEALLMDLSTRGLKSKLYSAIKTIYDQIGAFPNGEAVMTAIKDNIFDSQLIRGNAAEFGYAVGQLYWRYITNKEYGIRTGDAGTVGVSIGCRQALHGKYVYAFEQDITSYYYRDLLEQNPNMPRATGYMLKFYNDGDAVCADVFNLFSVPSNVAGVLTWDIGTQVLHTFTVTEFDEATIDAVAHEIAEWYDDHVQEAIDSAFSYN